MPDMRRGLRSLVAAAAIAGLAAAAIPGAAFSAASAAATVPTPRDSNFSLRFATNAAGDIRVIGNTLMSCPTGEAGCADAREGRGSKLNNNNWNMQWIDVDSDPATVNSSSSQLTIPADSPVLFAGLYWGAGDGDSRSGPVPAAANTVKFRTPSSGSYVPLTATTLYTRAANRETYTAVADVTALVNEAKSGVYTVADVRGRVGVTNVMAGWSLIVVYADTSEPVRALSVFDGLISVTNGNSVEISVSGFQTPPSGPVRTTLGFVTYEGDLSATGDTLQLRRPDGTYDTLTDSVRPATNFFNSTITTTTGHFTAKTPNYRNQLGFDAGLISADGRIANGATSATFRASTGNEVFYTTALTFATELFSPRFSAVKSSTDLNGDQVRAGDTLQYNLTVANVATAQTGDDSVATSITDTLPAGTTFVPGSLQVNGQAVPDTGGVLAISGRNLRIYIGTGATASGGGRLGIGASIQLSFQVTVDANAADGLVLANYFEVSGNAATSGFEALSASNEVRDIVTGYAADMSISKVAVDQDPTAAGSNFIAGRTATFRLFVTNDGPDPSGTVVVTDAIAPPMEFVRATGTGWDCAEVSGLVRCERDSMVPGSSAMPISLVVQVPSSATDQFLLPNTGNVEAQTPDPDQSNNASSVSATVLRSADLSIAKSHVAYGAGGTVPVGQPFTYTLSVSNAGPSDASAVTVTDTLPADVTSTGTPTGSGWSCSVAGQQISCTLTGSLDANAAAGPITVPVVVSPTVSVSAVTNVATVAGAETDPDPANDTASDVTSLDLSIDLVESIASSATAVAGGTTVITVSALNAGPASVAAASGLTQAVSIPAGATMQNVQGTDWNCAAPYVGPVVVTCAATAAAEIAAGASLPDLAFTLAIDNSASGSLPLAATVTSTYTERDTANNTAAVNLNPKPRDIDLALAPGTPSSATLPAGAATSEALQYVVTNNGPDSAFGPYRVSFPVSPLVTVSAAQSGAWSCTSGASVIECTLAAQEVTSGNSLPPLDLVVGGVSASTQPVTFGLPGVLTTLSQGESDTDLSNNTAADTVTITNDAVLVVTKSVDRSEVDAGESVLFTVTVENQGSSDARDVVLSDDLAAIGMTLSNLNDSAGACDFLYADQDRFLCEISVLPAQVPVTLTFTGTTPRALLSSTTLTNTATVTDGSGTSVSDDADVTVNPRVALSIVKTVASPIPVGGFEPGAVVEYTITVSNSGPSPMSSVVVTDVLPVGMQPVSASGFGWSCVYSSGSRTYTCTNVQGFVSDTAVLSVSALIDTEVEGSLVNTAAATPPTRQGDEVSDTATITVNRGVDLDIAHYGPSRVKGGREWVTYASIRNNGPGDEPGPIRVTIDERGAVAQAGAGGGWTCRTKADRLVCVRAQGLRAGQTAPLLTLRTPTSADTVEIWSTARVAGKRTDVDPSNNVSETAAQVVNDADIAVVKSLVGEAVSGGRATFDVTVSNLGPGAAAGVIARDQVPAGTRFAPRSSDPRCEQSGSRVVCSVGDAALSPGEETTFRLTFAVSSPVGSTITNRVEVSESTRDPNPANNSARADAEVLRAQVPDVDPSDRIRPGRPSVIYDRAVRTNASQTADVSVTCRMLLLRGDVMPCTVVRSADGAITVTTDPRYAVWVRVVTTAPAVPGYASMRRVYNYPVEPPRPRS